MDRAPENDVGVEPSRPNKDRQEAEVTGQPKMQKEPRQSW